MDAMIPVARKCHITMHITSLATRNLTSKSTTINVNEAGYDLLDPSHETKGLEDLPKVSLRCPLSHIAHRFH